MQHLTQAVKSAVSTGNSYAALALALTLPDICSSLERGSTLKVSDRYAKWWDTYVGPKYRSFIGGRLVVFMEGRDCWAIRCKFLHEGSDDVTAHGATVLERFHFVQPNNGNVIHRIRNGNRALALQVDMFCTEMLEGVEEWWSLMDKDSWVAAGAAELLKIDDMSGGLRL